MEIPKERKTQVLESNAEDSEDSSKGKQVNGFSSNFQKNVSSIKNPSLPPSISSSPVHEFSFTISTTMKMSENSDTQDNLKNATGSIAIDLSPADDIFFRGHLLPLHLVSHPLISPRTSTTSVDNINLPIYRKSVDQNMISGVKKNNAMNEAKLRRRAQTFSVFRVQKLGKEEKEEEDKKKKKKIRFNLSRILKRYVRVLIPFLFLTRRVREKKPQRNQNHSFPGTLNLRRRECLRGKKGGSSAPASLRTSPVNSGRHLAYHDHYPPSESTMEELQNAIQAAIAHCKSSTAIEDNCKFIEMKTEI